MTSEREFVRQLQKRFSTRPPVEVGIGDDGAVVNTQSQQLVVVTDMLLDGRHFECNVTPPELIGRKSLAVNLSDLAAMACWPTAAFVSIAIPTSLPDGHLFVEKLYDGMEDFVTEFGFTIAGGDTNSWDGPFAINVCMTGTPIGSTPVLRSGARPGDVLLVTGSLGGSLVSQRHLTFEPRLNLARWLVENADVHAMMDISDGLAVDLHRMMEASSSGAILDAAAIPISDDVDPTLPDAVRLRHALSDGEDFELLLAASRDSVEQFLKSSPLSGSSEFVVIGEVTKSRDVILSHGDRQELLEECGWQHHWSDR